MNTSVDGNIQQPAHHLKTFHSPATSSSSSSSSSNSYNLKKTVQSLTRKPITHLQSTYFTYDSIDAPPPPPPPPPPSAMIYLNHSSTTTSSAASSTSREYSI